MSDNQSRASERTMLKEAALAIFDFETVTPSGRPPEPLELAVMCLAPGCTLQGAQSKSWLIKPPADAPLTAFDTRQTGIRRQDIEGAPDAATVLQEFDRFLFGQAVLLIGHNARYDKAILDRFAHACPHAASLPCLDTLALGTYLMPGLDSYTLDALAAHCGIPIPNSRHRALPDVKLAALLFLHLTARLPSNVDTTLAGLLSLAGLKAKPGQGDSPPSQPTLW